MPSADSPVVSLEGAAMPYFIYRIFESTRAENVAICDHFDEAQALEAALRESSGPSRKPEVKMIESDTDAHARELLFHVRSPEEGLIGDS
jgi:hypothetical protein